MTFQHEIWTCMCGYSAAFYSLTDDGMKDQRKQTYELMLVWTSWLDILESKHRTNKHIHLLLL